MSKGPGLSPRAAHLWLLLFLFLFFFFLSFFLFFFFFFFFFFYFFRFSTFAGPPPTADRRPPTNTNADTTAAIGHIVRLSFT